MVVKINSNPNFRLTMKLDVFWDSKYINVLVILDNLKNGKQFLKQFKASNFDEAIKQYDEWENMLM